MPKKATNKINSNEYLRYINVYYILRISLLKENGNEVKEGA